MKADQEVVLEAVKQNGMALKYASDDLKADPAVVLEAVKQNIIALKYDSKVNDKSLISDDSFTTADETVSPASSYHEIVDIVDIVDSDDVDDFDFKLHFMQCVGM